MSEDAIKKFWLNVTAYYQKTVPNEIIAMYAYDSRDLGIEELRRAFEIHRHSLEGKFFPVPAALRVLARPPLDEDAEAHEAVSRIMQCMAPFKAPEAAKDFMGELAWEVVKGMGGWRQFGMSPPPNDFVQRTMYEKAKGILTRSRHGRAGTAPQIGGSNRPQIAAPASDSPDSAVSKLSALTSEALKGKSLE